MVSLCLHSIPHSDPTDASLRVPAIPSHGVLWKTQCRVFELQEAQNQGTLVLP